MKRQIFWLLAFQLACATLSTAQPATQFDSQAVLDDEHIETAKALIVRAKNENQYELLYTAAHNKNLSVQLFCFDQIGALTAVDQAALLARLWLDDNLLRRADEPFMSSLALQTKIQFRLETMSYALLGQVAPSFHGILSRAEATSLATRLRNVQ